MGGDGRQPGLREAIRAGRRELALYLAAGALYVALGVAVPEFMFSWVVAAGYLLACVVLLPALLPKLLARRPR